MKRYIFILLTLLPMLTFAQEDESKYLTGAITEVNGKVVFSKEINTPNLSQDQVYDTILRWAQSYFKTDDKTNWGRVLYTDKQKGEIACLGSEYIVFTDKALSLDRAKMNYLISIYSTQGKCKIEVSGIRYVYQSAGEGEKQTAEETITDKYTLNKDKTKLSRGTKKFRIKTIDYMDNLFNEIQSSLGVSALSPTIAGPVNQVAETLSTATNTSDIPSISGNELQGYKQIAPDKIPGNIIKMLSEDWMLITAGREDDYNMMTASWGGLGHLYNKPIAFCFIYPTRHTYQLMEKGDTYTISFYTEAHREVLKYCGNHSGKDGDKVKAAGLSPVTTPSGSKSFSEAWMIIECKKLISQSITPEAIHDEKLKKEWNDKPLHKMYIGEIINVWVK